MFARQLGLLGAGPLAAMIAVGCGDAEPARNGIDASAQHADSAVTSMADSDVPGMRDAAFAGPDMLGSDAGSDAPVSISVPHIQLQRKGALGFCIEPGQLMSASIEAAGPTQPATLLGGVFLALTPNCSLTPEDCAKLESRERTLSAAQRNELSASIAALPVTGCDRGNTFVCDPCLVTEISVDGKTFVFDGGCSPECGAVLQLGALLDRLASDPPVP